MNSDSAERWRSRPRFSRSLLRSNAVVRTFPSKERRAGIERAKGYVKRSQHVSIDLQRIIGRLVGCIPRGAFILVALSIQLNAQTSFPLALGNTWHYSINYYTLTPTPAVSYTVRVVGDSLMPNGKQYWILDPFDMFGKYIRSDSAAIYYWQHFGADTAWSEKKVFDMRDTIGTRDTINFAKFMFATAGNTFSDTLFFRVTRVKTYGLGGLIFGSIAIADRFGYVRYEYDADLGSTYDTWDLIGCIIADTLYGEMTRVPSLVEPPEQIELLQNYPNPFNPVTNISLSIPQRSFVSVKVYDLLGREVSVIVSQELSAGNYTRQWNAGGFPSGVYFYRLQAGSFVETKKLLLLK